MSKPADFLLGVIDFFAVLIPGAAFTWLVMQYLPHSVVCSLDVASNARGCGSLRSSELYRAAAFLVTAYVLGHFVFMLSAHLDGHYDKWRSRTKPLSKDQAYLAAKALMKEVTPELAPSITVLKWTMHFVQIHCPGARIDIERLEASQKLFRSLVVVSGAVAAHFLLREAAVGAALTATGVAALCFARFCDQRWKMTQLSYATALILRAQQLAERQPANPAATAG